MKAAGITPGCRTHGFHILRRSGGKMLYEITHDPKLVQHYLGHSKVGTTMDSYVGDIGDLATEATDLVAKKEREPSAGRFPQVKQANFCSCFAFNNLLC